MARPKNTGPYGEPTKIVRVPVSMVDKMRVWLKEQLDANKPKA